MNLTKRELEGIVRHHFNELFPQLPPVSGQAGDMDDIYFVNRENDAFIPEYLASLHDIVDQIAPNVAITSPANGVAVPNNDSLEDEDRFTPEDFKQFLSEVPLCCTEFLLQAELALENDDFQDACYRAGFVSGCVEAFNVYVGDQSEHSSSRSLATAWSYLPYISCIFDGDDPETVDEDRTLNDATFVLGLIHGLLWFSDTDFPLHELTALFDSLPTSQ